MQRRTFLTSLSAAALTGTAGLAFPSTSHAAGTGAAISQVPWSARDLVNPGRGQYSWQPIARDTEHPVDWLFPQATGRYPATEAWPGTRDLYLRLDWRYVERGEGQYDFGKIDEFLDWGEAHNQRLTLRVMPVDSGTPALRADGVAQAIPDYMLGRVNDWVAEIKNKEGRVVEKILVPDWNNQYYLQRVEALLAALGRRYDLDDRLWAIDVMGHGNWGEWHDYPYAEEGRVRAPGRDALSEASMVRIVDANFRAFPHTKLLMLTANVPALKFVMHRYAYAGIRVDSLGDASGGWAWPRMQEEPWSLDRWRYAPVVVEYMSGYNTAKPEDFLTHLGEGNDAFWRTLAADAAPVSSYEVARRQVMRHHVSLVSSGNHHLAWDGKTASPADLAAIKAAYKFAGYRYSVTRVQVDRESPTRWMVRTTWRNAGVAPTYDRWDAEFVVKDAAGTVVATQPVGIDLHWLVNEAGTPEGSVVPAPKDADVWTALETPQAPPPGQYTLCVRVNLPVQKPGATRRMGDKFYEPMALAQRGRHADGCYPLVTITV